MAGATMDDLVAEQKVTNAILRAAFKSRIDEIVEELLNDRGTAAILSLLTDSWTAASELTSNVSKQTGLKERAVQMRLSDLVEDGIMVREGAGRSTSYCLAKLLTAGQVARIRSVRRPRGKRADAETA